MAISTYAEPIVATKLFVPPLRARLVSRPRLSERLENGVTAKLALVCAPAGFGKTTMVSAWAARCGRPVAWLSLDESEQDPAQFMDCLLAALQTIMPAGIDLSSLIQSSRSMPTESVLTTLLNRIVERSADIVLILDDYHLVDTKPVNDTLGFLIDHLPPCLHLVITTRSEPDLPLARWRARGQLIEVRQTDLRFTVAETAGFLNQVMELGLSDPDIATLESRTEGWIAGLQLAALSLQNHPDASGFIHSFSGSNRFVLDYLLEEVLQGQPQPIQQFLLRSSILDRLSGPLCDAVLSTDTAQETLECLERANLFIIPLDNCRGWYRYHHLFSGLLRQRLQQSGAAEACHCLASQWFEANDQEMEAFHHAVAAGDLSRATRLVQGRGMPLYFRGAMAPVTRWLDSLPHSTLDANPALWITFAWSIMISGQPSQVEVKLRAAELILPPAGQDAVARDLAGQIATLRAMVSAAAYQVETSRELALRALDLLSPSNLAARTAAHCMLGYAHLHQGNRLAASQSFSAVLASGQASGNMMFTVAAMATLGSIQEMGNSLRLAADTYQRTLALVADPTHMAGCEVNLGLARIHYEWNDLEAAEGFARTGASLAAPLECDTLILCQVLRARIQLARQDPAGASEILQQAELAVPKTASANRRLEIMAAKVEVLLHQGKVPAAFELAKLHELPVSQARALLGMGDAAAARLIVEDLRRQADTRDHADDLLKTMILQTLVLDAAGETDQALELLQTMLVQTQPEGFIRSFVDAGKPMASLLSMTAKRGVMPDWIGKLLSSMSDPPPLPSHQASPSLVDPLTERELEILQLISRGLSNQDICGRLFLSLSTIKWHNQNIFDKLGVQRRTEAVARARALNLLAS